MKRTVCLIVLFLLSQLLSSIVILFALNLPALLSEGRMDVNLLVSSPSAVGATLMLSSLLVCGVMSLLRWTDRKSFRGQGYGWNVYVAVVLWMVPVIFLVNLLTEALSLNDLNEELFLKLAYNPLGVIALVLVGPFAEELVFRMGIQRHLMRRNLSPWMDICLAGLVFGVVHGNPAQIPGAVLFGWGLGWLYWRSGTIWIPVAAHVFNNAIGVLAIVLSDGKDITMAELCGGTGVTAACVLLALVWGVGLFLYLNRHFRPLEKQAA